MCSDYSDYFYHKISNCAAYTQSLTYSDNKIIIYMLLNFLSSRPNEKDFEPPFFFVLRFNLRNSAKSSVICLATTLEILSRACFEVLKNNEAYVNL